MTQRMSVSLLALIVLGLACDSATEKPVSKVNSEQTSTVKHIKVYYEPGMFGGWPANHGIWSWGNEILVGFTKGYYKDLGPRHNIDREKPELHMLARSLDGGESWKVEDPGAEGYLLTDGGYLHGVPRPDVTYPELQDCEGDIDFTHPDFALTMRTNSTGAGIGRFFYSYDRGHSWEGPYRLPNFGLPGTAVRTDFIVNGKHDCMLFITGAKPDGKEGRSLCVQTSDGGKSWEFLSWIGPESKGSSIMPASARLSETDILAVVRCRENTKHWQSAYLSQDNARSWQYLGDPVPDAGGGNPPALIKLQDGRACLIYGFRGEPFSIRAKLSSDKGHSWSEDIVLRDDGASKDLGYPRVVQRPDGKVVVVYYFNDPVTGPERYIGATIWTPPPVN